MKFNKYYFINSFLACFIFLCIQSCGKKQTSIFPSEEKITSSVYASGIIKSFAQYEVYSKVGGIIEEVLVKEGEIVKKDQPIYKLANKTQALIFENAKLLANFSSENANEEKLNQAQTEMDVAKLKLDNDFSLLERQKKLWEGGIGSKNELEQRELAYKNAIALYHASQLNISHL